jgi:LVIVD repeat
MRDRISVPAGLVFPVVFTLLATGLMPAGASTERPRSVLRYRAAFEARIARQTETILASKATASQPVLDDFTIVGHNDLGAADITGDVWVHEDTAYLGTWAEPCNGLGVKVVDVSDPANPAMLGRVAGIPGTSAEDVVVRSVSTDSFTGDLLVAGIQRCDFEDTDLDDDTFGVDIWNVSNPGSPVHFTHFGINTGGRWRPRARPVPTRPERVCAPRHPVQ